MHSLNLLYGLIFELHSNSGLNDNAFPKLIALENYIWRLDRGIVCRFACGRDVRLDANNFGL